MANVLIVEDEILVASHIKQYIVNHGYNCAGIAISYAKAIDFLEKINIDIILLDVNIFGGKSGIDLAEMINEHYKIPFIYLTSYSDAKTLETLKKTFPVGYLSKPINEITLTTTLDIVLANQKKIKINHFTFQIGTTLYAINLNELMYIKSDHVYVELVLKNEKLTIRSSLKKMAKLLPDNLVKQANRSTLVNPIFIKILQGNRLKIGGVYIKISKIFKHNFDEMD